MNLGGFGEFGEYWISHSVGITMIRVRICRAVRVSRRVRVKVSRISFRVNVGSSKPEQRLDVYDDLVFLASHPLSVCSVVVRTTGIVRYECHE